MADLPPFMDEERRRRLEGLIERTGERWLSFSEAVALLREREPMSIGQAEAIIDDLRMAYFADGGPFDRRSGKSTPVRWHWFHDTNFLTNKPNRNNTFVSEADLIQWLEAAAPGMTPTYGPRAPAPRASKTQIHKIVAEYLRTAENPTMDGAWLFAQSNGVTGHQKVVRDEYSEQSGRPGAGRRRKNP